jgi:hypothetical protein
MVYDYISPQHRTHFEKVETNNYTQIYNTERISLYVHVFRRVLSLRIL